jgi:hypothetical protein
MSYCRVDQEASSGSHLTTGLRQHLAATSNEFQSELMPVCLDVYYEHRRRDLSRASAQPLRPAYADPPTTSDTETTAASRKVSKRVASAWARIAAASSRNRKSSTAADAKRWRSSASSPSFGYPPHPPRQRRDETPRGTLLAFCFLCDPRGCIPSSALMIGLEAGFLERLQSPNCLPREGCGANIIGIRLRPYRP